MGKENRLIEKTIARTEESSNEAPPEPRPPDIMELALDTRETQAPSNGRRQRRSRRNTREIEPHAIEQTALATDEPLQSNSHPETDGKSGRMARAEKRRRPRAPLTEKTATSPDSATVGVDDLGDESAQVPEASVAAAEALVINLSGKKPNRGTRTAKRARRKQEDASAALKGADNNPALGALNRHLNMLTQQLGTAHRVIGRIAAERDALRQQLADIQGIPVEQIVVTSLGASTDQPATTAKPVEPRPTTGISRFNYFGGDDIAVMRKRRQMLVIFLLLLVIILWWTGRMGYWVMPDNLSRDSITHVPFIGEFMSYFLAGWLFFRFVRVSSKGVKWVFPSEDPRRRRR